MFPERKEQAVTTKVCDRCVVDRDWIRKHSVLDLEQLRYRWVEYPGVNPHILWAGARGFLRGRFGSVSWGEILQAIGSLREGQSRIRRVVSSHSSGLLGFS